MHFVSRMVTAKVAGNAISQLFNAKASQTVMKRKAPPSLIVILLSKPMVAASGNLIAKAIENVLTVSARAIPIAEQKRQLIFDSPTTKSDDWHETAACSRTRRVPACQVNRDLLYRQRTARSLITHKSCFVAAH